MADAAVAARQIALDPDPLEAYRISAGFVVGDLILLSGQGSIDEQAQVVHPGDFAAQFERTLTNIDGVLRLAGSRLERVVKATIYLTDMAHFPQVVELRERFGRPYPADTIVEVASLAHPDLLVEIDVIALAGDGRIEGRS